MKASITMDWHATRRPWGLTFLGNQGVAPGRALSMPRRLRPIIAVGQCKIKTSSALQLLKRMPNNR